MLTRALLTITVLGWTLMPAAARAQAQRAVTRSNLAPLDYFQVKQLYARFVRGLDSGADNGALFADVFTPDGVLIDESGQVTEGHAKLAALARASGKGPTHIGHYETNLLISPLPGRGPGGAPQMATGRSFIMSVMPGPAGKPGILTNSGQYWDEIVKTPDGWRFKKREFHASPVERQKPQAEEARP